jgi:radical SAM protein with 4Fe4S-binding SPASM domain
VGAVQICGFLDVAAGNLRENGLDFKSVWDNSSLFREMRDLDKYHGRCGRCEYRRVCGGCRARAYATTGDYLAEEPYCVYEPLVQQQENARA